MFQALDFCQTGWQMLTLEPSPMVFLIFFFSSLINFQLTTQCHSFKNLPWDLSRFHLDCLSSSHSSVSSVYLSTGRLPCFLFLQQQYHEWATAAATITATAVLLLLLLFQKIIIMWSLAKMQMLKDLTKKSSLTNCTMHEDLTFWKVYQTMKQNWNMNIVLLPCSLSAHGTYCMYIYWTVHDGYCSPSLSRSSPARLSSMSCMIFTTSLSLLEAACFRIRSCHRLYFALTETGRSTSPSMRHISALSWKLRTK